MSFGFDCCCQECCDCKQYIIKLNNDITIGIYTIKAGYYALTGPIQLIGITDDSNHSYCSWSYTYLDQYSLLLAHDTIRKRWVLKLGTAGNEDTKLYIENFIDCDSKFTIGPAIVECSTQLPSCKNCWSTNSYPKTIQAVVSGFPSISASIPSDICGEYNCSIDLSGLNLTVDLTSTTNPQICSWSGISPIIDAPWQGAYTNPNCAPPGAYIYKFVIYISLNISSTIDGYALNLGFLAYENEFGPNTGYLVSGSNSTIVKQCKDSFLTASGKFQGYVCHNNTIDNPYPNTAQVSINL